MILGTLALVLGAAGVFGFTYADGGRRSHGLSLLGTASAAIMCFGVIRVWEENDLRSTAATVTSVIVMLILLIGLVTIGAALGVRRARRGGGHDA